MFPFGTGYKSTGHGNISRKGKSKNNSGVSGGYNLDVVKYDCSKDRLSHPLKGMGRSILWAVSICPN